ncbi:MAG: UbiA prenyltransferase family protein [Candidatus Helarchaeota archaeon]
MDVKKGLMILAQKLFSYIEIARVSVIFMGLPFAMAGAAYALSLTLVPISLAQAIVGVVAVFLVTGGVHTIDDYFDRKRDRMLWPDRPLPSRGLTPKGAILIYLVSCGIGFVLISIFFNISCVFILLIATIWTTTYTGYLRERIGYLTLPFAIGLFPIGGFVAFAPNSLLNNLVPWLFYLMVFCWQSAHILAYSPPHGIKNGRTLVPMFIKRFSPETTLIFAGVFNLGHIIVGVIIAIFTTLSYLFYVLLIGFGIFLIILSFRFAHHLTTKNCMFLVFLNSVYGWLIFIEMTLEFLLRYNLIFFEITLIVGIVMMLLSPLLGGFGLPTTELEEKKETFS